MSQIFQDTSIQHYRITFEGSFETLNMEESTYEKIHVQLLYDTLKT